MTVITLEAALLDQNIDLSSATVIKIGTGSDHTEFYRVDGTIRYRGEATIWKDMVADLFGKRLNSTAGKVDYDWDDNAINFQSGGSLANAADRLGGNQEINHEMMVGSSVIFKPHIHWFQAATTQYELSAQYRIQRNGEAMTTTWTPITLTANDGEDVFTYSSGILNQLTRFPDISINCSISDTLQWQMARTDSLGGSMLVYFFDLHGKVDSGGSNEEISKRT